MASSSKQFLFTSFLRVEGLGFREVIGIGLTVVYLGGVVLVLAKPSLNPSSGFQGVLQRSSDISTNSL